MEQQRATNQEGQHSGSPSSSQRIHVRFTTSNLFDHIRKPNSNKSAPETRSPTSPRGNAANKRLIKTRTNSSTSSQQPRGSQQTLQAFSDESSFSQRTVTFQDSLPESGQDDQSRHRNSVGVSSTFVSEQPMTQEWATQIPILDDDKEEEEGLEKAEALTQPRDTTPAGHVYIQEPSFPLPPQSLSPSSSPTQLSQPNNHDIPIPSTDDSLELSQLVCGQRLPSCSPTPNVHTSMDSQPYDGFEDVYNVSSRYSNEANDFNDNVDKGILVADDSLAVASGEALSWSVSPQRAEQANSAEEDKQEDHQSDQDDIVVSTYHDRRFKYHTQPQAPFEAAAAEEEEEGAELRAEPLSPEVDSEFEDHVESYYRKPAPSASQTSVGTRDALTSNIKDSSSKSKATATAEKQTRNRRAQQPVLTLVPAAITPTRTPRRRSIPDDVKRQLNKDAIDLLLQNPHMNSVFLSVDIPVLPEYSEYRKKITATPEAEAEDSGRKRVSKEISRRQTKLPSSQPPLSPAPPPSPSPSPSPPLRRQLGRQPVQHKGGEQLSGRRSGLRARTHRSGSYLEVEGAQDEEELQEDAGSDGYEDRRTTPSIHYQSVHRHLLPPKKRIRTLVSFQENQASESWPARRGRLRIVPISGSDSSSDAGLVVRNGRRKNFGRRKRLSSTPLPSAEEQEQEEEGIVAESSESSPSPQEISPRVLDEAEGNNTQDEGGEQHRELTKLRRAWKEHGIHWPLQTATAVVNVTSSHRLRGSTPEEYSTNFVFGSALPLPR